jgi:hypothetical protein
MLPLLLHVLWCLHTHCALTLFDVSSCCLQADPV